MGCLIITSLAVAQLPEIPYTDPIPIVSPIATKGKEAKSIDEIAIKQKEMRDTVVLVRTIRGSGSGTIIESITTDNEDIFEYRVLTNAHVTHSRFFTYLTGADSITGKIKIETVDTGCEIITFDYKNRGWENHNADVIAENIIYDLAMLSFVSSQKFAVAKIADDDMLKQVRVFDEVFAVGCQFGRAPTPTIGIISQILIGTCGEQQWILYGSTAQITPGSSGGGLFKEYGNHYYLVGIPYRTAVAYNGQFIPHLSYAISIATAIKFIDKNTTIDP